MNATLIRAALAAAALTLAIGCGDSAGDDNNGTADNANPNANPNNAANNGTTPRPDLVEADGCMPDFTRPNPSNPSNAEADYLIATEDALAVDRQEMGAFCGSVLPVDIDWNAMLSSVGFDDDEVTSPAAVAGAVSPFLNTLEVFCNGLTPRFSDRVSQVIITATDTDARIGLCWEDASTTLVYRIKLDADATTATTLEASQITDWLNDTLP